jgi:hypothetical protein
MKSPCHRFIVLTANVSTFCHVSKVPSNVKRLFQRLDAAIGGNRAILRDPWGETYPARLRRIDAGKLVLPTGRMCVADAFSSTEFPPLNVLAAPGEFPVEVIVAQPPKRVGPARGAFVVITFRANRLRRGTA